MNSFDNINSYPKEVLNPLYTHSFNYLLIIGNGFDLYNNLRTDFKSFIKYEKDKYVDFKTKMMHKEAKNSHYFSSFFIRYFEDKNKTKNNWSDIEEQLYEFVHLDSHRFEGTFNNKYANDGDSEIAKAYYDFDRQEFHNHHNLEFTEWISNELTYFEKCFTEYLLEIDKDNVIPAKESLFSKIMETGTRRINYTKILNFNYTKFPSINRTKVAHIHGSIEKNNIIIGYDLTKQMREDNNFEWSLTKTFRSMDLPYRGEFALTDKIDRIIFYGHSLGKNDYSYFQSIFDFYKIYSSDVILEFCYTNYDNKQKNITKQRIRKLLIKYGKTFDNKEHGKNLFHKLILEGRIIVREIL